MNDAFRCGKLPATSLQSSFRVILDRFEIAVYGLAQRL